MKLAYCLFLLALVLASDGGVQALTTYSEAARMRTRFQQRAALSAAEQLFEADDGDDTPIPANLLGAPTVWPEDQIAAGLLALKNAKNDAERDSASQKLLDTLKKFPLDKIECNAEVKLSEKAKETDKKFLEMAIEVLSAPGAEAEKATRAEALAIAAEADLKVTVDECKALIAKAKGAPQAKFLEIDSTTGRLGFSSKRLGVQAGTRAKWGLAIALTIGGAIALYAYFRRLPVHNRQWTAARPCPQTQGLFGYYTAANHNIHNVYAYAKVTANWFPAMNAYASAVGGAAVKDQAARVALHGFATANVPKMAALTQSCFDWLGALAGAGAVVNSEIDDAGTQLPGGFVGGGGGGAGKPQACAELCAFAVGSFFNAVGGGHKSCSATLSDRPGILGRYWIASISVSGGAPGGAAAVPAWLPANVNVPGGGNTALRFVVQGMTPAEKSQRIDTCTTTLHANVKIQAHTQVCNPMPPPVAPAAAWPKDQAWSPASIGTWVGKCGANMKTAAGAAVGPYPGTGPLVPGNPVTHPQGNPAYIWTSLGFKGECSEDKAIKYADDN